MASHLYLMRPNVGAHTETGHDGQPHTYAPGTTGLVLDSPDPTLAERFPEKFQRCDGFPAGVPVVGRPAAAAAADKTTPEAPAAPPGKGAPQGPPAGGKR